MMSTEAGFYILECERRFELERAELRIKRGIADEINNAGFGLPDWLTALARGLRSRLSGRGQPAAATVATAVGATPEGAIGAWPLGRRLCAGEHRRQSLICDDCGAVIRTVKPACSTTARRARKTEGAANRQTV